MKKLSLMLLLISGLSKGQYLDNLTYGLKLGALHSRVTNLPEMLIGRENNRQLFDITSKGVFGVEGGLFLNYKLPASRVAIQPELLFRYSGAEVNYNNETTGSSCRIFPPPTRRPWDPPGPASGFRSRRIPSRAARFPVPRGTRRWRCAGRTAGRGRLCRAYSRDVRADFPRRLYLQGGRRRAAGQFGVAVHDAGHQARPVFQRSRPGFGTERVFSDTTPPTTERIADACAYQPEE